MSRISELPQYAKDLGMEALAITDHGAMFGVVDFYKSCKKAGIKPVIGCEVYTAARTMFDRDIDRDRNSGHLILLAEDQKGYSNLVKIVSRSYVDGFYFKPRVDKALLRQYATKASETVQSELFRFVPIAGMIMRLRSSIVPIFPGCRRWL